MRYHMVAVSLPRKGHYLCLHKHKRAEQCRWTEADRETFIRIREQIQALYETGPISTGFNRSEVEMLYDNSLTSLQAVNRILPYYLGATLPNQKCADYIEAKESDIEIIGPAGTEGESSGIRLVTVSKGAQLLEIAAEVLEAAGAPDLSTLEGRSSRKLAEVVAWSEHPVTLSGKAKVLAVPAELHVKVSRAGRSEFVTEIPKIWE